MDRFREAIRLNPGAAKKVHEMQDVLDLLNELRASGVARGSEFRPFRRRGTLADLENSGSKKIRFKMTSDA